ncbi:hypothetical protein, partial [Pseudomonas syringae group genomosp. 7]|uniref:hypothetical protein n=1 Tax=Pseudomonas syringae group genomosp. 7 TaxID=251699 RepID=UPI00376FDA81
TAQMAIGQRHGKVKKQRKQDGLHNQHGKQAKSTLPKQISKKLTELDTNLNNKTTSNQLQKKQQNTQPPNHTHPTNNNTQHTPTTNTQPTPDTPTNQTPTPNQTHPHPPLARQRMEQRPHLFFLERKPVDGAGKQPHQVVVGEQRA